MNFEDPESYLKWEKKMDRLFEYEILDDKKMCKFAIRDLGMEASIWWEEVMARRVRAGKSKISSWESLKRKLKKRYVTQTLRLAIDRKMVDFEQENSVVGEYVEEIANQFIDGDFCSEFALEEEPIYVTYPVYDNYSDVDEEALSDEDLLFGGSSCSESSLDEEPVYDTYPVYDDYPDFDTEEVVNDDGVSLSENGDDLVVDTYQTVWDDYGTNLDKSFKFDVFADFDPLSEGKELAKGPDHDVDPRGETGSVHSLLAFETGNKKLISDFYNTINVLGIDRSVLDNVVLCGINEMPSACIGLSGNCLEVIGVGSSLSVDDTDIEHEATHYRRDTMQSSLFRNLVRGMWAECDAMGCGYDATNVSEGWVRRSTCWVRRSKEVHWLKFAGVASWFIVTKDSVDRLELMGCLNVHSLSVWTNSELFSNSLFYHMWVRLDNGPISYLLMEFWQYFHFLQKYEDVKINLVIEGRVDAFSRCHTLLPTFYACWWDFESLKVTTWQPKWDVDVSGEDFVDNSVLEDGGLLGAPLDDPNFVLGGYEETLDLTVSTNPIQVVSSSKPFVSVLNYVFWNFICGIWRGFKNNAHILEFVVFNLLVAHFYLQRALVMIVNMLHVLESLWGKGTYISNFKNVWVRFLSYIASIDPGLLVRTFSLPTGIGVKFMVCECAGWTEFEWFRLLKTLDWITLNFVGWFSLIKKKTLRSYLIGTNIHFTIVSTIIRIIRVIAIHLFCWWRKWKEDVFFGAECVDIIDTSAEVTTGITRIGWKVSNTNRHLCARFEIGVFSEFEAVIHALGVGDVPHNHHFLGNVVFILTVIITNDVVEVSRELADIVIKMSLIGDLIGLSERIIVWAEMGLIDGIVAVCIDTGSFRKDIHCFPTYLKFEIMCICWFSDVDISELRSIPRKGGGDDTNAYAVLYVKCSWTQGMHVLAWNNAYRAWCGVYVVGLPSLLT